MFIMLVEDLEVDIEEFMVKEGEVGISVEEEGQDTEVVEEEHHQRKQILLVQMVDRPLAICVGLLCDGPGTALIKKVKARIVRKEIRNQFTKQTLCSLIWRIRKKKTVLY